MLVSIETVRVAISEMLSLTENWTTWFSVSRSCSESAATAQNDKFKAVFIACITSKLNQEAQYLASILSDMFVKYIWVVH